MTLPVVLRSEMLKMRRTASFYLAVFAALPIPAILLLNILTGGSDLNAISKDPMNLMFEMCMERNGVLFFPIFVILVGTLLTQVEYRNNTWKQVFAAPQTKSNVFFAKFININLLMLLFLFANLVFMLIAVVITHFYIPSLNLLNQPFDVAAVLMRIVNAYLSILALCSFQFWLSLRFRNFIAPIGIGLALWFVGVILLFTSRPVFLEYYPYSFQAYAFIQEAQPKMPLIVLTSVAYAIVFLLLGFLDFRRRRLAS